MTPGEATREFYRKQGRLEQQARIIKLLEDNWVEPMDWLSVIALIKGEK